MASGKISEKILKQNMFDLWDLFAGKFDCQVVEETKDTEEIVCLVEREKQNES
jgi:hypothetical protein